MHNADSICGAVMTRTDNADGDNDNNKDKKIIATL